MTQRTFVSDDALDVLSCVIDVRPAGAPTSDDLAPALRGLRREGATLALEFDPAAAETVVAFAAAEQRCCAGIGWEVEHGARLILHVRATPAQLDQLAQLWPQASTA
jgi:hypothetical protein